MPIGFTSLCTDTISPRSCTLDCTLVFVRGKQVWRICVVRACVALACMQGMTRAHVKMKCKEKNGTFHFYCSYAFVYNLHMTIFSRVYSYVSRVYSYVTRMLLVYMLLVYTRV